MESTFTEITRTVWTKEGGVSVSPDPDGLGEVRVYSADQWTKDQLFDIDFIVSPEMAKALGEALIATANEQIAKEKK